MDGDSNPEPRHLNDTNLYLYIRDIAVTRTGVHRDDRERGTVKTQETGLLSEFACSRVPPPPNACDTVEMPYVSGKARKGLKHVPNPARILSCGKLHEHSRPHSAVLICRVSIPSQSDSESAQASDRDKPRLLYSETLLAACCARSKARDCLCPCTPIREVSRQKCNDETKTA